MRIYDDIFLLFECCEEFSTGYSHFSGRNQFQGKISEHNSEPDKSLGLKTIYQ